MKAIRLSIVTTMYRSAAYLPEFYRRVTEAAQQLTDDFEIIFVNDGSPDNSVEVAYNLYQQDERVVLVDLSRNFGHHKAMMTGLSYAQGDLVFLIDCDLEEPPELLLTFHEALHSEKADVIYGVQRTREGTWFRRISGKIFYRVFNALSDFPLPKNLLTVRLMSQRYVQQLVRHREQIFVISGLWAITGFKQVALPVDKHYKGISTYNLSRRLGFVIHSITGFSNRPLIYISYLGLIMTIPTGLYILWLLVGYLVGGIGVDGWTSVIVSLWFLGGLIIFILGIIAIYLSVIFVETKDRPYSIVREVFRHEPVPEEANSISDTAR